MGRAFDLSLGEAQNYGFFSVVIIGLACQAPATPGSERDSSDPALFREVVLAIKEHVGPEPLAIDPRPLIADPAVLYARDDTRAPASANEIASRRAVLHDLGIPETSDNGGYGDCPGVMVPPPPPPGVDRKKVSCPPTRSFVVNVGLPRPGGAYLPPPGAIDEREIGRAKGYVAVRALVTSRGPEGVSKTAYDLVMARDSRDWKLVKKVALYFFE